MFLQARNGMNNEVSVTVTQTEGSDGDYTNSSVRNGSAFAPQRRHDRQGLAPQESSLSDGPGAISANTNELRACSVDGANLQQKQHEHEHDYDSSIHHVRPENNVHDERPTFNKGPSQHDRCMPNFPACAAPTQQHPLKHATIAKIDDDLLHRAIADAGRWAYGTVYVELWVLNEARTHLVRPEGGWWMDPTVHTSNCGPWCALCRLTDNAHPKFLPPLPLAPGVGLPGVLWAELYVAPSQQRHGSFSRTHHPTTESNNGTSRGTPRHRRGPSGGRREMTYEDWRRDQDEEAQSSYRGNNLFSTLMKNLSIDSDFRTELEHPLTRDTRRIAWRKVTDIANDPNQPHNVRLQALPSCGLDWAAAVPFEIQGHTGTVIYMARESVNLRHLQSSTNEAYLRSASDLIGSAWALRGPRQAAVKERQAERDASIRRARTRLLDLIRKGISLEYLVYDNSVKNEQHVKESVDLPVSGKESIRWPHVDNAKKSFVRRTTALGKKCMGSNNKEAPNFSWNQTGLTFCGVFLTLLMLTNFNDRLSSDLKFALAPFGALVTLQYGLTAAPASQPKYIIVGQTVSISIALVFRYIPMNTALRTSLATALAVASMVKFGVTHPPAGAATVIFVTNPTLSWGSMGFMLIADLLAIGSATLINNISEKRQYPTFWGLGFLEGSTDYLRLRNDDKAQQETTKRS